MTWRLADDRTECSFADGKPRFTREQAVAEATRCLYCTGAPCVTACPTGIDIPQFIRKITTDNVRGSAKTIFESNILGQSCARVCPVEVLCVGACVHNHQAIEPIAIGRLQRYATDRAVEAGWTFFEAGAATGKSVAIIGGGPAGLACAHELRRSGHAVTIFEKRAHLGGLNASGIAPYKLKSDAALSEVDWVLQIGGIEVVLDSDISSAEKLAELDEKFDAVFVGVGLGSDTPLAAPGATLPGVIGAVEWIERIKLTAASVRDVKNAVVIGGGNTAMDVVRELAGLNVPRVTLVYRGTEESMSGYRHEWEAAEVAGVRAEWRTQPVGFVGDAALTALRVVELDESRHAIAGSERLIDAELAILAIGQATLGAQLAAALPGITLKGNAPIVDKDLSLGRPGWFAGGDLVVAREVVDAVAEGKQAAHSIDRYLGAKS